MSKGPAVVRPEGQDGPQVSFLDLVELQLVRTLVEEKGVSLPRLQRSVQDLTRRKGLHHPLARERLYVTGGRLFAEDGSVMLELGTNGQTALSEVIRACGERLEFDRKGIATRWHPMGRENVIVIDPRRGWGEPCIEGTRLTTHAVKMAVVGEGGNVAAVAAMYGIKPEHVQQALDYESKLAA